MFTGIKIGPDCSPGAQTEKVEGLQPNWNRTIEWSFRGLGCFG